jgi:sugar lactone lactonase YvrE
MLRFEPPFEEVLAMRKTIIFVAAAALAAGCAPEPESPTAESAPASPPSATPPAAAPASRPLASASAEVITAERGGFIPEGIEYDEDSGRFLSGSLAEGTIFVIERDGRVVPFIEDPELVSSVGIEVDEDRDRLLVANSNSAVFADQNAAGHAKLGVYHSMTGERLAMVDLGATIGAGSRHFANDVTVDDEGNAYVTDSFANAIYRVTPDYRATVMYRFMDLPQGALLNGIVYHGGGYLLVVAGDRIYKVPRANPEGTTQVNVSQPVDGQDGIVLTDDGRLVATSNSTTEPRLVAFTSGDDWQSAERAGVAVLNGQATTAAIVGDEIWAVHPHFSDAEPPTIERALFQ